MVVALPPIAPTEAPSSIAHGLPTNMGMRYFGILALFLWMACGAVCQAAPSLRLPVLHAGGKVYSNALITVSAKNRLLVEYEGGLTSVKLPDLEPEVVRELNDAGVVSDAEAKEILRKAPKKAVAKVPSAERESESGGTNDVSAGKLAIGGKGTIANLLGEAFQKEVRKRGAELDVQPAVSMVPIMWQWILSALVLAAWLCRRCLYYRIVQTATGNSSFLVFLPFFYVFPLMRAAHLSVQWLLIPIFAVAGLFAPPVLGDSPQVILGYYSVVGLLWLATGILHLAWCVRLCQAVDRTGWLALLLALPVLDWIALFILASSQGKLQTRAAAAAPDNKRLVLAV